MSRKIALFDGFDASNQNNLWVTDGTSAGTSELSVAGAGQFGLLTQSNPPGFTVFGGEVLFQGTDASLHQNLWVTDGTSVGTTEFSVAGAASSGLSPSGFTVFGSKVLFRGTDTSGNFGLWVTNGTSAGTSELSVAGANSSGLSPVDLTVLGGKVLFEGSDATRDLNPWVTDGTSAGTSELAVAGADPSGLSPGGFTVLGSEALFAGTDASFHQNVWVTDGTSVGTFELSVAGASPGGLGPSGLTVLGGEVLFEGRDASGHLNLWVTDGTSAGTSELSVAGAASSGLAPSGFTVLGGKVLFVGFDASNDPNLWVTDGTLAGTSELSVAEAFSAGLFAQLNSPFFTGFGSEVLFQGTDANDHSNLWVTDGTSAGTSELSVAGAWPGGLDPFGFTVFGSKVLFQGTDASGNPNLWVTDGTSAGTSELPAAGANSFGLSPTGLTVLGGRVADDFTGDGTSDVLLYHAPTGTVGEWLMQNGQLMQAKSVGSLGAGSGWSIAGTGDFNGDGTVDTLVYHAPTGTVGEWLMQNGQLSQANSIAALGANSGWSVAGTGDFNGDGTDDVLLYHAPTGTVGEWLMQNGQLAQAKSITAAGSGWSVVGTGDFNGDGTTDILVYNAPTGTVGEWLMQNGQLSQAKSIASLGANSGWSVVGTGDLNGDGTADVLLYDAPTGTVGEWLMQGGQISHAKTIVSMGANSGWSVAGTGDFNGDGTTDILLNHSPTGTIGEWLMQNGQLSQANSIASLGTGSGWQTKQV